MIFLYLADGDFKFDLDHDTSRLFEGQVCYFLNGTLYFLWPWIMKAH